jgi:hypothetical protein
MPFSPVLLTVLANLFVKVCMTRTPEKTPLAATENLSSLQCCHPGQRYHVPDCIPVSRDQPLRAPVARKIPFTHIQKPSKTSEERKEKNFSVCDEAPVACGPSEARALLGNGALEDGGVACGWRHECDRQSGTQDAKGKQRFLKEWRPASPLARGISPRIACACSPEFADAQ